VSIERFLWAPVQPGKVRIFSVRAFLGFVAFSSFTLKAAFFLLALFHLPRFFTISFCERCFAWSCDDALLGRRTYACGRVLLGGAALPFSGCGSDTGGGLSGRSLLT
jgi:hypothetical protein